MLLFQLLFIQIITFFGLVFILRKIMYSASFKEARRLQNLSDDYSKRLQTLEENYRQVQNECNLIKTKAREDAQNILKDAKLEGERVKKEYKDEAKKQKDYIIQEALSAKDIMKKEIENRMTDKAIGFAKELVKNVFNLEIQNKVNDIFLNNILLELKEINPKNFHILEDNKKVFIITACNLSNDQREKIQSTLGTLTGMQLVFQEEIDESIISGIILRWDNFILDASMLNKFKQAAEKLGN